jgi:hypothetical protein
MERSRDYNQDRNFTNETDLAVGRHIESLTKDILLHFWTTVLVERVLLRGTFAEHFVLGPDIHRDFQECLVQKGDAGFETPSHCGPFRNVRTGAFMYLFFASNRGRLRTCWPGDNLMYVDSSLCERILDGTNVRLGQRGNRDNLYR